MVFDYAEEDSYYKPLRVGNFQGNNCIEYKINNDRNKTLLVQEYFDKIRPYLKDIIYNLKKPDTWKIQLKQCSDKTLDIF